MLVFSNFDFKYIFVNKHTLHLRYARFCNKILFFTQNFNTNKFLIFTLLFPLHI